MERGRGRGRGAGCVCVPVPVIICQSGIRQTGTSAPIFWASLYSCSILICLGSRSLAIRRNRAAASPDPPPSPPPKGIFFSSLIYRGGRLNPASRTRVTALLHRLSPPAASRVFANGPVMLNLSSLWTQTDS